MGTTSNAVAWLLSNASFRKRLIQIRTIEQLHRFLRTLLGFEKDLSRLLIAENTGERTDRIERRELVVVNPFREFLQRETTCQNCFLGAGLLQLDKTTKTPRIEHRVVREDGTVVLLHVGERVDALEDFLLAPTAELDDPRERHQFLRAQLVKVLRLGVRVPRASTDEVHLEADRVDLLLCHVLVHDCRDLCPVPLNLLADEAVVQRDARVPLDANKVAHGAAIQNDGLDDAAVRDDGIFEFLETRATLALVVARSTERLVDLISCGGIWIHLQKLANARVRSVKFNTCDRHGFVFSCCDHRKFSLEAQ
jgi:hypothetical protein